MKNDIAIYCKECPKCFVINPKLEVESSPLCSINVPAKVWSLVGIDIIGPLQESAHGNKYIVAMSDHFSKWSEASAIPNKTAKCVADFLYSVVCRLGCMDTLISDQGREFVNKVIDFLLESLQTEHRISSAYHPQTNGQRERDNRTLKSALSKLVNDQCDDWDIHIPGVLFAYHTSKHASTNCTPFQVMYGRIAKLPIDISESDICMKSGEHVNPEILDTLENIHEEINSKVNDNIVIAQKRQKHNYDKRHSNNLRVSLGNTVYIKNSRRIHRMGSKLEPRWVGPYKVIEMLGKGRVRLENIKSGNKLKNVYNIANLKCYTHIKSPKSDVVNEIIKNPSHLRCNTLQSKKGESGCDLDLIEIQHPKSTRIFSPISPEARKKIARFLNLTVHKTQYFGKEGNLNIPGRVYITRGDGNCYFRAISYIITGSEENHLVIRNRVVQYMCGTISDKLQKYLNQSVNNYVNLSSMARNGVWATDAEIMATASLLEHDIVVYTKSGDSCNGLHFLPHLLSRTHP